MALQANAEIAAPKVENNQTNEAPPKRSFDTLRKTVRAGADRVKSSFATLRAKASAGTLVHEAEELLQLENQLQDAEKNAFASGALDIDQEQNKAYSFSQTKERLDAKKHELQSGSDSVQQEANDGNILAKRAISEAEASKRPETVRFNKGQEYFQVNEPFDRKVFRKKQPWDKEAGPPSEANIYAEIVSVSEVSGKTYRTALVRKDEPGIPPDKQTRPFFTLTYTEEPNGERIFGEAKVVRNGEQGVFGGARFESIGNNLFTIESLNADPKSKTIEMHLGNQQGKKEQLDELIANGNPRAAEVARRQKAQEAGDLPSLSAEPTNEQEKAALDKILEAADRYPDIDFNIEMHKGGYEADEAYINAMKNQIKGSWVMFAEKMGLDPKDFPMETVELWAPLLEDKQNTTYRNRMRNAIYKRRPTSKTLNATNVGGRTEAFYKGKLLFMKKRLAMPVAESGVIDFGNTAHELFHSYLDQRNAMGVTGDKNAKFIDEGMATIANNLIVPEGLLDKKIKVFGNDAVEKSFTELVNASLDYGRTGGKNSDTDLNSQKISYGVANSILHLYLVQERGGIDSIKALINRKPSSQSEMIAAYRSVYGESMTDLAKKARMWFAMRE